jgi:hypothetical protein
MANKWFGYLLIFIFINLFNSCKKEDKPNIKAIIPASSPEVTVSENSVSLSLPGNCQKSFTISNTGPQGSSLNYSIKDDGAVSGYLDFTNSSGTLLSGQSATITVSIKADSTGTHPIPMNSLMVLDIYTPEATNYVKVPVSVSISNNYSAYSALLGTWSGTWKGISKDTIQGGAGYLSQINGTWQINFLNIDTIKESISGTLIWKGTDTYWTPDNPANGFVSVLPNQLNVNKTINFDSSNSTIAVNPASPCGTFIITIGSAGPRGSLSADEFYGPIITADLNIEAKTISQNKITNIGFITHPYNPTTSEVMPIPSNGSLSGAKN